MLLTAPVALLEALQEVQKAHPYTEDGDIPNSPRAVEDSDRIWARLLSTEASALDEILTKLSALEIRLVLFGARARLDLAGALGVLGRFFAICRPAGAGSLAFDGWLLSADRAFLDAAREYAAGLPERTHWARLLESADPLQVALSLLAQSGQPLAKWSKSAAVSLADRPLVIDALRRRCLEGPNLIASSRREPHRDLFQWANLDQILPADRREAWFALYLKTTYRERCWPRDSALLEGIVHRFQEPSMGRPFWNTLPPEVTRAVKTWINAALLNELLQGPRLEFWLRYLSHIDTVEGSRGGEAVFVSFDTWFAVQFKDMGRATYLFPRTKYLSLMRKDEASLYPGVLEAARYDQNLGRYAHHGEYWQGPAQTEVDRVLRKHSKIV